MNLPVGAQFEFSCCPAVAFKFKSGAAAVDGDGIGFSKDVGRALRNGGNKWNESAGDSGWMTGGCFHSKSRAGVMPSKEDGRNGRLERTGGWNRTAGGGGGGSVKTPSSGGKKKSASII